MDVYVAGFMYRTIRVKRVACREVCSTKCSNTGGTVKEICHGVCCVCECVVSFHRALREWIPPSYPLQLSLRWSLCRGVLSSRLHTSFLGASLQSDSHCCMSWQEGGSEEVPGTEIKDVIKREGGRWNGKRASRVGHYT